MTDALPPRATPVAGATVPETLRPPMTGARRFYATLVGFLLFAAVLDLITVFWLRAYGARVAQEMLLFLSSAAAFAIGALSAIRYRIQRNTDALFIAAFFLFLGLADGLSLVGSTLAQIGWPSFPPYALWLPGRAALVLFALLGVFLDLRGARIGRRRVYWISLLVGAATLALTASVGAWSPMLHAFRIGSLAHPLEALPFAVLAAVLLRSSRGKQTGPAYRSWLGLFFGFQALASGAMLFSGFEYDAAFFLALLLKLTGVLALPIGIAAELLSLFREREAFAAQVEEQARSISQAEQRLEAVLDAMPMGVLLTRVPEFRAVMMNTWLKEFYGPDIEGVASADQFLRRVQLQHRDGRPYATKEMTTMVAYREKRVTATEDVVVVFPDGSRRFLRSVSAPIVGQDGEVRMVVQVLEDISARVRLEQQLEDRENALLAAYERAKDHEKEIIRLKDQFLFVAVHELRTPVNAIRWNIELLEEERAMKAKIPKEAKERMEDIGKASFQLLTLVEDLLNISRLEYGTLRFEQTTFPVGEAVDDAVHLVRYLAKKGGIAIVVRGKETLCYADRRRLTEVLVNLLTNGIKYNRPKGSVTVAARTAGGNTVIDISDTGIGIAAEDVPKLFQRFSRVQTDETRDIEGTGLGLFIVKSLVERMGGAIRVQSAKGVGTTFTIALPIPPPPGREAPSSGQAGTSA